MVNIAASTLRYKLLLNSRFLHHRFNVDAQIIRGTGWPTCRVGRPRCKEVVRDATNHSCFHSFGRHAKRRADMQGWPPEMQKKFCISDGQPCMSALLFYCFTILLFYCFTISLQVQYCRGRCLGLAARDAKKFSTYHHVLQQNVVFASRTANLACRPSYSIFFTNLLFYFFTPRPRCKKTFLHLGRPTLHVGPPILLFYEFTIFLFCSRYSTAAANVWG